MCEQGLPDLSLMGTLEDVTRCLRKRPEKAWGREKDVQEAWGRELDCRGPCCMCMGAGGFEEHLDCQRLNPEAAVGQKGGRPPSVPRSLRRVSATSVGGILPRCEPRRLGAGALLRGAEPGGCPSA